MINWVWGVTAGSGLPSRRRFFFFGHLSLVPSKESTHFPGVWMLRAQIRSGEFELPALDIRWTQEAELGVYLEKVRSGLEVWGPQNVWERPDH